MIRIDDRVESESREGVQGRGRVFGPGVAQSVPRQEDDQAPLILGRIRGSPSWRRVGSRQCRARRVRAAGRRAWFRWSPRPPIVSKKLIPVKMVDADCQIRGDSNRKASATTVAMAISGFSPASSPNRRRLTPPPPAARPTSASRLLPPCGGSVTRLGRNGQRAREVAPDRHSREPPSSSGNRGDRDAGPMTAKPIGVMSLSASSRRAVRACRAGLPDASDNEDVVGLSRQRQGVDHLVQRGESMTTIRQSAGVSDHRVEPPEWRRGP